jgi:hypothetical protein
MVDIRHEVRPRQTSHIELAREAQPRYRRGVDARIQGVADCRPVSFANRGLHDASIETTAHKADVTQAYAYAPGCVDRATADDRIGRKLIRFW